MNKHNLRSKTTGKFICAPAPLPVMRARPTRIQNGSLYGYKGIVVRCLGQMANGNCVVGFHKVLNGVVPGAELELVGAEEVNKYLRGA